MGIIQALQESHPSLKDQLSTKKMLVPIANYIQATGRFEQGGGGNQRQEEQTQGQREEDTQEEEQAEAGRGN
jgi:hypothetical protein